MIIRRTYFLILLCMCAMLTHAKPQYVFQSVNPIANFAWNENDTLRYEGHYRYENAYRMIEDMLTDKHPLDFAEAVFAVENCMYDGKLDRSAYLAELNRIATAPLHSYIRHQDANGNWWNFETTVGGFSRSSFIMESFHVSEKAIRSGLYMTNLTAKETIVQCLYDLLCIYERKTGFYSNDFVRKCCTLGLKYHYPDNLHTKRINDLKYQLDKKAWNKGLRSEAEVRSDAVLGREYNYLQQQRKELEELGYHEYTPEEYLQKYQETLDYLQKQKNKPSK